MAGCKWVAKHQGKEERKEGRKEGEYVDGKSEVENDGERYRNTPWVQIESNS